MGYMNDLVSTPMHQEDRDLNLIDLIFILEDIHSWNPRQDIGHNPYRCRERALQNNSSQGSLIILKEVGITTQFRSQVNGDSTPETMPPQNDIFSFDPMIYEVIID